MHRDDNVCYVKLVCLKTENVRRWLLRRVLTVSQDKVLGIHYFGPNAGEVMQVIVSVCL